MKELLDKKVFLLDVEGVLCDNIDIQTCLPRVPEFISFLKDHDIGISIVTNISRKPRQVVFDKLKSMGIPVLIEEIFTSGSTTAMFIKNQYKTFPRSDILSSSVTVEMSRLRRRARNWAMVDIGDSPSNDFLSAESFLNIFRDLMCRYGWIFARLIFVKR